MSDIFSPLDRFVEWVFSHVSIEVQQYFATLHHHFAIFLVAMIIIKILLKMETTYRPSIYITVSVSLVFLTFFSGRTLFYDVQNSLSESGLSLLENHLLAGNLFFIIFLLIYLFLGVRKFIGDKVSPKLISIVAIAWLVLAFYLYYTGESLIHDYGAGVMLK